MENYSILPLSTNPFIKSRIEESILPKPIPIYTLPVFDLFPARQQSVIKSTNVIPKCESPKIQYKLSEKSLSESSKSTGNRRLSYAREYKLMVIDYYLANGQNKYRTCKKFHITKSMLNGWLQKAEKIVKSRPGSLKTGRSGRRPQFPNVEEELYRIYVEFESQGQKIENDWIKEVAQKLAQECGIKNQENNKTYQFGERWLSNFKRRYNITQCKSQDNNLVREKSNYSKKTINNVTCNSLQTSNQTGQLNSLSHSADKSPIQTFYNHFPWFFKCKTPLSANNQREQISNENC